MKNLLPKMQPHIETLARNWLILAISALAIAGLFSLPPVILRGPFFADKLPVELIFSTALVIHVDMSVIIWFCAIGGLLWSLLAKPEWLWIYKTSVAVAAVGMAVMAASPFIGAPNPLKNNYIPVLQNATFFIGLSLFACGMIFQNALTLARLQKARETLLGTGIYISAAIAAIAMICFVIAHNLTPLPTDGEFQSYYEAVFWGGGHVLQYCFTTTMLLAWLWLADLCNIKPLPAKVTLALLAFNLLLIIPSPLFYLSDNIVHLFTQQMRHGGGISALIIGGAIIFAALKKPEHTQPHAIKACLVLSILLFGYGGVLGYMISGVNVTIPAHYHGSIVAVTLAFMGLAYYLLPTLGFGKITGKMATAQPYIYGIGQVMHITGLAWMGGYGALRKSAASSHTIDTVAGKALFFSGGAFAIVGGLLFVIVAVRALMKRK